MADSDVPVGREHRQEDGARELGRTKSKKTYFAGIDCAEKRGYILLLSFQVPHAFAP